MKEYVTELNLEFDPFDPGRASKEFFAGGERRSLVDQILELSLEGNMLAAVTGPQGSGKSAVAREVCNCFGDDAVCILVPATQLADQAQFLDAVGKQLPKHKHIASTPDVATGVKRLRQFAAELDMEAHSLILIVDDAHELSTEVLALLDDIVQGANKSSVRAILLGEKPLLALLQNTLTMESQVNLAQFELAGFSAEDTRDYLGFKLSSAGFHDELPLSSNMLGAIYNSSLGMPGAINALAAESLSSGGQDSDQTLDDDADFIPDEDDFNFNAHDTMQFDLDMTDGEALQDAEQLAEEVAAQAGDPTYEAGLLEDEDELDSDQIVDLEYAAPEDNDEARMPVVLHEQVVKYRYPIAASLLGLILIITLFVWNTGEVAVTEVAVVDPAGAVNTGTNRIQLAAPVPVPAVSLAASTLVAAAVPEETTTNTATTEVTADLPEAASTDTGSESELVSRDVTTLIPDGAPAAPLSAIASEASATVSPTSNPVATTEKPIVIAAQNAPENVAQKPSATVAGQAAATAPEQPARDSASTTVSSTPSSTLTAFERELMSYANNSYTVQILASHSETNVQRFVDSKSLSEKHGYYETRHLDRPWFVVVAGNYRDRAAANAVIERLPAALRESKPWVRSVGDIQQAIQQLHDQ